MPDQTPTQQPPAVFRIPPIALMAVAFGTLGILVLVVIHPLFLGWTFIIPIAAAALVLRLRTVVDTESLTVRTLFATHTYDWDDVAGFRFTNRKWARARLNSGEEIRLPTVTFRSLPRLSVASGGRVTDPYAAAK